MNQTKALAFVPGPREIPEPFFSTDLEEVIEHPIADVARVFEEVARPMGPRTADPYKWKWRWESGDSWIELGFSAMESANDEHQQVWGGSQLDMNATPALLLVLWNNLRARLPAVWIHDSDCRMYRPESFAEEWSRLQKGMKPCRD